MKQVTPAPDYEPWGVFMNDGSWAAAGIAALGMVGSIMGYLLNAKIDTFNAKLDNKIDYSAVAGLIETSIDHYHQRIVAELKKDVDEKHKVNQAKIDKTIETMGEVKEELGEVLGLLKGRTWRGPSH